MILIAIQFIRPPRNNGGYETLMAFEKETSPSVQVATILKENCYDCHSAQTQYPWYAEIAPISYWLSGHIDHGKSSFNVSVWNSYSTKKKDQQLEALIEQIQAGEMPLESYTWIHGKLSEDQKMALLQWVGLARLRYKNALQVSANEPL
jgi:hypothetical protein